jgi:hypothetical protein
MPSTEVNTLLTGPGVPMLAVGAMAPSGLWSVDWTPLICLPLSPEPETSCEWADVTGLGESVMFPWGDKIALLPPGTAETGVGVGPLAADICIGEAEVGVFGFICMLGGNNPAGDGPDVEAVLLDGVPKGG